MNPEQPTRAEYKRARAVVLAGTVGKKLAKRLTRAERDEALAIIDRELRFEQVLDDAVKGTNHAR
jgi:hypothetical protein